MGRGRARRLLTAGALTVLVTVAAAPIGGSPARADDPDRITISGIDLASSLVVTAAEQPELFTMLYEEVGWLLDRSGDSDEPDAEALGVLYTMVVEVDGEPRHRFHLYPLADGGPRVFRPAEQPGDRSVREEWYFGRLSLPESLTEAGAPLTGDPVVRPGGDGGAGGDDDGATATPQAVPEVLARLDDWRWGLLLTGTVTVLVAAGLAGIAFLIRRKV